MKKILDILAIILPLLLLSLPIFRRVIFGKAKKAEGAVAKQPGLLRVSRTFLLIVLLLIGILRYLFYGGGSSGSSEPKPEPLSVSKHSSEFNESLQRVLNAYYSLTDAFSGNDTVAIHSSAVTVKEAFDNFKMDELKKDSTIYLTAIDPVNNAKAELESILVDPSMDEKRGSLNILSDNLRNLLVVVKYDLAKVYWQQCDEAFGEDKPGNWLSRSSDSKNPYPLKNNLPCGIAKDTLNYIQPDSIKN
ncbi:MAG: DUF3347 domain-containing protein [Bacteroidetes bacterium]|nr:DUF3347 domain-containing protein [Bacteroidota bacterium]MBS1930007.1 DUF3347 domain-containing protein [Bacteroidota bacterium]